MRHHIYRLDWLRLHPVKRGETPNKVSYECESYASQRFGISAQVICFRLAARSRARYLITHASEVQAVMQAAEAALAIFESKAAAALSERSTADGSAAMRTDCFIVMEVVYSV